MSENHIYVGEIKERAISRDSLATRLDLNKKYQSRDFHSWLHERLNVKQGEKILDVGCGTGSQTLEFIRKIGDKGNVSCLDISADSVDELNQRSGNDARIQSVVSDMAELKNLIQNVFTQKEYTLAHSSYALYYSPERLNVLKTMVDSIYDFGRVAVFTPVVPHGMVELASRYSEIPDPVMECLEFGPNVLEPAFRSMFWDVEIDYFQSMMNVDSIEDFMNFYKATTYYDENAYGAIEEYAKKEIAEKGCVSYEKNGYLIIGRDKK